ncbi:MAG: hypothetical protein HYU84_05810 [Chloroflexi bacterium]|nr:hypothetical protein [Chloroflexota bacterium]MBI3168837.1 hypothetical protein [Chloroflexota bacterium]
MAIKSKTKSKAKVKAVAKVKSAVKKGAVKASAARKAVSKLKPKTKASVKNVKPVGKFTVGTVRKKSTGEKPVEVTRTINLSSQIRQPVKSVLRKASLAAANPNLFNFMKAPRAEYAFEVGDTVEVFCDHEKGRERVRGWIKGIVVQVDNKMVAVQFRSNVFLTDGWMVPDRILWYPLNSEHIRPVTTGGKKPVLKKDVIPDY